MTELIAIVRRKRAAATKEELSRIGCHGYTAFPVLGRGRQRGLRGEDAAKGLPFLPKVLFNLIVPDEAAQETIEAIVRANQTGEFGDGKLFVVAVEDACRISTGERHQAVRETGVTS